MLEPTGERFLPWMIDAQISYEHLHRYAFVLPLVKGKKVLDIACGEGYGSNMMSGEADSVLGIDIDFETIKHAQNRYIKDNLQFLQGSLFDVPVRGKEEFDIIVSFESIEHISEHEQYISEMARLLKQDGIFIVSTPNKLVYSDGPSYKNPFHKKELYFDEFSNLLRSRFKYINLYGQKIFAASRLWTYSAKPLTSIDELRIRRVGEEFQFTEQAPDNPVYIIAMASNLSMSEKVNKLSGGWLVDVSNELLSSHEKQIREFSKTVENIEFQQRESENLLKSREASINQLDHDLRVAETLVNDYAARLKSSENQVQDYANRLKSSEIQIQELSQLLKSTEARISEQTGILQARDLQIRSLETEQKQLQNSLVFQFLCFYQRKIVRILPGGSRRRAFYELVLAGLRVLFFEGWRNFLHKSRDWFHHKLADKRARSISARQNTEKINQTELANATPPGSSVPVVNPEFTENIQNLVQVRNQEFFRYILDNNINNSSSCVPISTPDIVNPPLKLIAFYLPQYHPIPENDEWWGKGFTEWNNVARAVPQFIGHHQPHLPGELGFYDLRVSEVQERQVELAKRYGIYGFCFHFYWFNGKTLLDKPIKQFIHNPDIDFHFCINWANENWTRRWDGLDQEVLIDQKYSPDDDIRFIEEISHFFTDKRYIRVNNKPLLIVYRPGLLPDPAKTAARWRKWCTHNGIGEIFLALTHSFEHLDPRKIGFDAAVEFAPNTFPLIDITKQVDLVNENYNGIVYDYCSAVSLAKNFITPSYKKFRSLCPGWDNEPRKPGRGIVLANSSPGAYREWLKTICDYTTKNQPQEERFVFINAWNEWAEGAYLEPDRKYGYAYLKATSAVLISASITQVKLVQKPDYINLFRRQVIKKTDTAVIIHLFYSDLWEEFCRYLENLEHDFDLYISTPGTAAVDELIHKKYPDAYIYHSENKGRDMLPFMLIYNAIYQLNYDFILKIHTKKSPHRVDGDVWRQDMCSKLLGSREIVKQIKDHLRGTEFGMIAPAGHVVASGYYWGSNEANVKMLCERACIDTANLLFPFVAGSMFWAKPSALIELFEIDLKISDFENECGQIDGTLAHALERFVGLIVTRKGYKLGEIDSSGIREAAQITTGYAHV